MWIQPFEVWRVSFLRSYCKVTGPHTILLEYLISLLLSSFMRHFNRNIFANANENCQHHCHSSPCNFCHFYRLILFQFLLSNCHSAKLLSFWSSSKRICSFWTSQSQTLPPSVICNSLVPKAHLHLHYTFNSVR